MICSNCGCNNAPGATHCMSCGSVLAQPVQPPYSIPYSRLQIPNEYTPLSPWAYVGYQILFAIPLVGIILLIIFSCGGTENINLKNYARSYWCNALIYFVLFIIIYSVDQLWHCH